MTDLEENLNNSEGQSRRQFLRGIIEATLGFGTLTKLATGCAQSPFQRWSYDIEMDDRANPRIVDLDEEILAEDILNVYFTPEAVEALRDIPFGIAESIINNNDYEVSGVAFVNDIDPRQIVVREDTNYCMILTTIHEYIHQGTSLGFIDLNEFNSAYERLRSVDSPIIQYFIETVENHIQSSAYDDDREDPNEIASERAAYLGEYMSLFPELFPDDIWNVYSGLLRRERITATYADCEGLPIVEDLNFDIMRRDDSFYLNRLNRMLRSHQHLEGILQTIPTEDDMIIEVLNTEIEHSREELIDEFSEFFLYRLDRLSNYINYARRCVEQLRD